MYCLCCLIRFQIFYFFQNIFFMYKWKTERRIWITVFLNSNMGWALYLTIALIAGSLIEADIGSCSLYCEIYRFGIIVEKKLFKTLAVSLTILNFGSFDKCYLFTGHNFVRQQWFSYFPKFFIIAYIFYTQVLIIFSFTFSQKCDTQVSLLFLRKIFLSFVLNIIALDLDKDLFIKGEWLLLTYFFFRGAWLSKILLQKAVKRS